MERAACHVSRSVALEVDIQRFRRENEEHDEILEQRHQTLKSLRQRKDELHVLKKKMQKVHTRCDNFLKVEEVEQLVEEAEKERREGLQLDAELEKLKLVRVEVMEKKQEQERQIQQHTVIKAVMEQACRMSRFKNRQELADHIHNLLHIQDDLQEREKKAYEQVDQLRESLLTLEDNVRLQRLQKNLLLSRLQTKLDETHAEAKHWESKWNNIQETAAKKTITLGQIKMATLSLYEMTGDRVEGDGAVDKNDTVKQLDKVMMFMQDHEDILKQYETAQQKHDGQEKDKPKSQKEEAKRAHE
ncbi:coiled-coil domain-containing protein 42 homolog [Anarrhichthys ocellatus]|uniref:coiled-coil domain-containing protein 42 homolog n=1 Tax=Anarrhichthys ocellatus TaxID=433405 RepID=UPI0012ED2C90|nr:coiled-coil domain-containing protein 42 homolog [Anarrhichthys ocellatus]